jgi:ABC-2 type transport system permease protein
MRGAQYVRVFMGILNREAVRWFNQRSRFISALVRPLVWLGIFAAGFRFTLGLSIIEPYDTYIPYEVYIAPGLVAMIQLFNGMQSSLSMVYDREMGSMKTLMISPFPRWYLLLCKLAAGVAVSIVQVYMFLGVVKAGDLLNFWDVDLPWLGYIEMLPAMILAGLMLGALGLVLSSFIKQLENFAGVMNFVIFPMFFASSALNPLWRVKESSLWLYRIYSVNPFSHAVELIRFSMYGKFNALSAAVVAGSLLLFMIAAVWGYDPGRGLIAKRGGPPE